ncbi:MlaD family protein [Sinomicrobium weinanense]|uniref:MCE family protein n=1 Tax=Sinomicrobium weinanense TaxID=2842200 RepID=A0A926JR40_9FLAO|nr:MlaD family protein [Sinomicrobium weinanense]MBC9795764.1 MCE family protein [Sinomicrobium weinanense]MBU3121808.1 MCE family protein [Sinomicrobium weinanense]
MTKSSENIKLGIFVIAGILFLLIAAYLIGNNQNLFSKTFTVTAVFSNVNGLQKGNNVRFSGIDAGTVKAIEMENDTAIRVAMAIDEKIQGYIKKDAVATIGSDGLVGNMVVNIIPGKNASGHVKDGDEIPSYSRIGADDILNTLSVTNENAALLTADLLKVTHALTQGKGTLGRLLNDTVMAADLRQTIAGLKHAGKRANSVVGKLDRILEEVSFEESVAGVLLSDTLAAGRMKNTLEHLESSAITINHTVKDLDALVAEIRYGEGALHYLATDTVLVRQLEQTMRHIEEGTGRFNENMEALKHNFLFRGYFRKLERQREKKGE